MKNWKVCLLFLFLLSGHTAFGKHKHKKKEVPRRLKIAFVIDTYDQLKSGAVVSAYRFVQLLREKHDITVITTGESSEGDGRERVPGFYAPFSKSKMKRNGIKFGWPNKAQLKKSFQDVDLVYVHFPFYLGVKSIKYAKQMGKPVVVGFHVQPENILLNIGVDSDTVTKYYYKYFVNKFYNKAHTVICPSKFAEGILKSYKNFKSKTSIVSNGLTESFRPTPSEPFPEYKDKFVILTVGRLSEEKRHDVIIDAIAKSKYKDKIQLVITGDGARKEFLENMGKKLPNPPSMGYVSKEDLIRLYNTSNLYIHASEIELEGMSVLEAIGSGMPAIISDSDASASKQFAINDDFLFQNGNSDQLSKKIDYWYEHPEELKQKAAEYAESSKKYYIENSAKKISKLFYKAVSDSLN